MGKIKEFIQTTALIGGLSYLVVASEYFEVSGPGLKGMDLARAKNSISAVVAGIVGQEAYGHSHIDLDIQKTLYPDAKVTGETTPKDIQTSIDLALSDVYFKAENDKNGKLTGHVDKSEFDWEVIQTGTNEYKIKRFGPKFDSELYLDVSNGNITGRYIRWGPHISWKIKGTYDPDGKVKIDITAPFTLDLTLKGKITKKPVSMFTE